MGLNDKFAPNFTSIIQGVQKQLQQQVVPAVQPQQIRPINKGQPFSSYKFSAADFLNGTAYTAPKVISTAGYAIHFRRDTSDKRLRFIVDLSGKLYSFAPGDTIKGQFESLTIYLDLDAMADGAAFLSTVSDWGYKLSADLVIFQRPDADFYPSFLPSSTAYYKTFVEATQTELARNIPISPENGASLQGVSSFLVGVQAVGDGAITNGDGYVQIWRLLQTQSINGGSWYWFMSNKTFTVGGGYNYQCSDEFKIDSSNGRIFAECVNMSSTSGDGLQPTLHLFER